MSLFDANIVSKLELADAFKAADSAETDPLDDNDFLNLEFGYAASIVEDFIVGVEKIRDKTDEIITGLELNYDKEALVKHINRIANKEWNGNMLKRMSGTIDQYVEEIYNTSKSSAVLNASFNVRDFQAMEYLKQSDYFYVGKQFGSYSDDISTLIREAVFEEGLGAKAAARQIYEKLNGVVNTEFWKYERVARTSANRVRNWSRVFAFHENNVATVRFVAVMDERTSEVCDTMNGEVFEVSWIVEHLEKVMESGEEALPDISPFPESVDALLNPEGITKDAIDLAGEGYAAPPLHPHCRSVLVVDSMRRTVTRS